MKNNPFEEISKEAHKDYKEITSNSHVQIAERRYLELLELGPGKELEYPVRLFFIEDLDPHVNMHRIITWLRDGDLVYNRTENLIYTVAAIEEVRLQTTQPFGIYGNNSTAATPNYSVHTIYVPKYQPTINTSKKYNEDAQVIVNRFSKLGTLLAEADTVASGVKAVNEMKKETPEQQMEKIKDIMNI